MKVYLRIVSASRGHIRIRLPANRDNSDILDFIERKLVGNGALVSLLCNAVTSSAIVELTGSYDRVLAELAANLPRGIELRAQKATDHSSMYTSKLLISRAPGKLAGA